MTTPRPRVPDDRWMMPAVIVAGCVSIVASIVVIDKGLLPDGSPMALIASSIFVVLFGGGAIVTKGRRLALLGMAITSVAVMMIPALAWPHFRPAGDNTTSFEISLGLITLLAAIAGYFERRKTARAEQREAAGASASDAAASPSRQRDAVDDRH